MKAEGRRKKIGEGGAAEEMKVGEKRIFILLFHLPYLPHFPLCLLASALFHPWTSVPNAPGTPERVRLGEQVKIMISRVST